MISSCCTYLGAVRISVILREWQFIGFFILSAICTFLRRTPRDTHYVPLLLNMAFFELFMALREA